MPLYFGTDGIRGKANRPPLDPETLFRVGRAIVMQLGKGLKRPSFVVGTDTRLSRDMIRLALGAGIASQGGDIIHCGILPTPAVAFLTRHLGAQGGMAISASHNPYEDNGVKIFSAEGTKLRPEEEKALEVHILEPFPATPPSPPEPGYEREAEEPAKAYAAFAAETFPKGLSMKGLSMVVDTANGAAYQIAPAVLEQLGARVIPLHNTPDGRNINADCGSQHPEGLQARVVETRADLGLAFDGDADRLLAVDEKGGLVSGDGILLICARELKAQGRLRNDLVVSTVMSNLA